MDLQDSRVPDSLSRRWPLVHSAASQTPCGVRDRRSPRARPGQEGLIMPLAVAATTSADYADYDDEVNVDVDDDGDDNDEGR